MSTDIDAILVVSFGGPEKPEDVMPFLRRVTAGRGVPDDRLAVVAKQYGTFGGVSPINQQTRELIAALQAEIDQHGPQLPIYWGNRNWHPLLEDTIAQMTSDGIRHAVGFATAAYSSYSSCRQYKEDIARAQSKAGPSAPLVTKVRQFYNHPGFIEPMVRNVQEQVQQFPIDEQSEVHLAFTAHSVPLWSADTSRYEGQLSETARLIAEAAKIDDWKLVYQSRSGSPHVPWLEPDIAQHLSDMHDKGIDNVVMVPIGFLSDHMEVKYDLDVLAIERANALKMNVRRAKTVGADPQFVRAVRDLINEHLDEHAIREALGVFGPTSCQGETCCPPSPPQSEQPPAVAH